jgi:hypothetical protein
MNRVRLLFLKNIHRYYLNNFERMVVLAAAYRKPFAVYILALLLRPLWVKLRIDRLPNIKAIKSEKRRRKEPLGWAIGPRSYAFSWFGVHVFSVQIDSEEENNVLHFYFFRSPYRVMNDLVKLEEAAGPIHLHKGMRVFEPGCNTGKMLFFLKDVFDAEIVGADVFLPAIRVAGKMRGEKQSFEHTNLVDSGFLKQFPDDHFDLTVSVDSLVHTMHYTNFPEYFAELYRISKQIYIHERSSEELVALLKNYNAQGIREGNNLIYCVKK